MWQQTLHSTIVEHTFLLDVPRTLTKSDHILGHKLKLGTKYIQSMATKKKTKTNHKKNYKYLKNNKYISK